MLEISAVILAGGLVDNSLASLLGRAVHSLPLTNSTSLLEGWYQTLVQSVSGVSSIRLASVTVVLSGDQEASFVSKGGRGLTQLRCVRESRRHRGTAGVVADQVRQESDRAGGMVLVVEASASPLVDLKPMFALASCAATGSHVCVLGESELGRYCGVCLSDRESLSLVPDVGFFDLKEQFLPQLRSTGRVIRSVTVAPRGLRLRSRADWLAIVEAWANSSTGVRAAKMVDFESTPLSDDRGHGVCLIERGAVTHGAVICSSIVMAGAVVESGAVVARSVIGPGAQVAAGSVVVDGVVPARGRVDPPRPKMSAPLLFWRQRGPAIREVS